MNLTFPSRNGSRWQNIWNRIAPGVICYLLGILSGILASWKLLHNRGLLSLLLAGLLVVQGSAQDLVVLAAPVPPEAPKKDVAVVCAVIYVGIACVVAVGIAKCVIEMRRAADCAAEKIKEREREVIDDATVSFDIVWPPPDNCPRSPLVTIAVTCDGHREPNWTLEIADSPVGPWTPLAEWPGLPSDLTARIPTQTVTWGNADQPHFFRLKGTR